jgi:hypothetical protein
LNIVIAAMPPRERAERRLLTITQCDTTRVARESKKIRPMSLIFQGFDSEKQPNAATALMIPLNFPGFSIQEAAR